MPHFCSWPTTPACCCLPSGPAVRFFLSSPPPGDALCGDEADKLARLLLSGTEREVLEYSISLEKLDRERFTALLDETAAALVKYSRENPAQLPRILHAVDLLKKLRSAASFYVGNGHLYGWLCAALFSDS